MLTGHQWLLLFLGAEGGTLEEVDQVRAMKGLFLLSKLPDHPVADIYDFEPYDYGPFDSKIYRDLDALKVAGLVEVIRYAGSTKRGFRLTSKGRERLDELRAQLSSEERDKVSEVKKHVTSLTFDALLKDIYDRFPEFRERSVARVAREAPSRLG